MKRLYKEIGREEMEYKEFFKSVTGNTPYHYQERLGEEPWPDLVDVPTGLGKTAGVGR
jgi:CRISPR-associated endonuclease/helicase Cas3